jgi:hypothetical protein
VNVLTNISGAVHSSVAAVTGGVPPPIAKAELDEPTPEDKFLLAVAKSFNSVQEDPSQNSVFATTGEPAVSPPKTIPLVCIPAALKSTFAEFISAISVQLVPFQDSTLFT